MANDNILPIIVKQDEENNESQISKLDEKVLPYVSMNELNYIAFDEPSIEYHIELFAYIQNKLGLRVNGVNNWLKNNNPLIRSYNWFNTDTLKEGKYTLPYCVRNNIDHPLNDDRNDKERHRAYVNNRKYAKTWIIKKSIDIMRRVIITNPNKFK